LHAQPTEVGGYEFVVGHDCHGPIWCGRITHYL
jgi:hypothetical protein